MAVGESDCVSLATPAMTLTSRGVLRMAGLGVSVAGSIMAAVAIGGGGATGLTAAARSGVCGVCGVSDISDISDIAEEAGGGSVSGVTGE